MSNYRYYTASVDSVTGKAFLSSYFGHEAVSPLSVNAERRYYRSTWQALPRMDRVITIKTLENVTAHCEPLTAQQITRELYSDCQGVRHDYLNFNEKGDLL